MIWVARWLLTTALVAALVFAVFTLIAPFGECQAQLCGPLANPPQVSA